MKYTARRHVAAAAVMAGFGLLIGGLLADVVLERRSLALFLGGAGGLIMLVSALVNRWILRRRAVGYRQRDAW